MVQTGLAKLFGFGSEQRGGEEVLSVKWCVIGVFLFAWLFGVGNIT